MWIVTDKGFFSFVVDRKNPDMLWLRARVREDLALNFPDAEIVEKPGSDYLFRALVPKEAVAKRMAEMIMEADITGHFKDVAMRRSAVPTHGSRSSAYYAFWGAMAKLQPYAPYSKTPRLPEPKKVWKPSDRTVGSGQGAISFSGSESKGLYGGPGAGYRASEFDWDSNSWGGKSTPDPALPKPQPSGRRLSEAEITEVIEHGTPDEVMDLLHSLPADTPAWEMVWSSLTPEECQRFLDEEEAAQRFREEMNEDFAAAARTLEMADVHPAPASRAGNRRQRRKDRKGRKNRHNQQGTSYTPSYETEHANAQRNRDGLNGQEARNRQAYLDKQAARKGGK